MLASIGSFAASSAYSPFRGDSAVALQAQLDKCQHQLGDWTACESGKTPEGKKIIQTLESKIHDLQLRIQDASTASSQLGQPSPQRVHEPGSIGSRVDTFA